MKNWGTSEWEIGRWFSTFDVIIHLTSLAGSDCHDILVCESSGLRERRFIMVISFGDARRWYPQSVFDSHRNKLQFDFKWEREREREEEAEEIGREGKTRRLQERRQGHTSTLRNADFPESPGRRACKSTSSRNATDYKIPLHFVGKISTCRNDLCWNAVGSKSSRYVIFSETIRFETTVTRSFIRNTNYLFE